MNTTTSGDFKETLYTIGKDGRRKWVYPALAKGWYFHRRLVIIACLMVVYLAMPWIVIDGKQAVFLDIVHRKFTFFGTTFWATDTRFLVMLLGAGGISLFFFTALFGRVWCGWGCPETVFLEFVFRPLERLIEGGPTEQRRLNAQPWSVQKVLKKAVKLGAFSIVAWALASTAMAYFVGRGRLIEMMMHAPSENPVTFFVTLAWSAALVFQFGWFREQFCTVLCPYARFQSVLLDPHSLLVGYDKKRGEPRGKLREKEKNGSEGDCIDCGLCVRVCPTGIDIRNGLQLECIQCAQCADACDSVMEKIGKGAGLVRYDTERGLVGEPKRFIRPRVVVYGAILTVYAVAFFYFLATREVSEFQVIRTPGGASFTQMADGRISNQLLVHIANKSDDARNYKVEVIDDPGVTVVTPLSPYPLGPGSDGKLPVFFEFDRALLSGGKRTVEVAVADDDGFRRTQRVTLLGPDGE